MKEEIKINDEQVDINTFVTWFNDSLDMLGIDDEEITQDQAQEIISKLNIHYLVEDVRALKRDFNTFSKWSEAYQQKIDRHYKEIEDLNKLKQKAEAQIKKCLEKAKEYGIKLKLTS